MASSSSGRFSQFDLNHRYHSQGMAAGGSALLDAVNKGKVHLAKFILDAGEFDIVNTRDFKGKTPLIRACYITEERTRAKIVDLLVIRGADVNLSDDLRKTALMYACERRCNDIIKRLLKTSIDPDLADNQGNTALAHSTRVGNDVAIEILIRCFRRLGGLNVDRVNDQGMTPLMIAASNGFIECASMLAIEGRACISIRDKDRGMNAEEWARATGCSTPEVLPFSIHAGYYNYRYEKLSGGDNDSLPKTAQMVSEASLQSSESDATPLYSAFASRENSDDTSSDQLHKSSTTPTTPQSPEQHSFPRIDKQTLDLSRWKLENADQLPALPTIQQRITQSTRRTKSTGYIKVSASILKEDAINLKELNIKKNNEIYNSRRLSKDKKSNSTEEYETSYTCYVTPSLTSSNSSSGISASDMGTCAPNIDTGSPSMISTSTVKINMKSNISNSGKV